MCPTQDEHLSLESFRQLYEVVFVDPTGFVNLTTMMIAADYQRVNEVVLLFIRNGCCTTHYHMQLDSITDSYLKLFGQLPQYHQHGGQLAEN